MIISYFASSLISFGVYFLMSFVFLWVLNFVPNSVAGVIQVITTSAVFSIAYVRIHHVPNAEGKREFWKIYEENPSEYDFASDLKFLLNSRKKLLMSVTALAIGVHILMGVLNVLLSPTSPVATVLHFAFFPFNAVFSAIDHPIKVWEIILCCVLNVIVVCASYILCLGIFRKKWHGER